MSNRYVCAVDTDIITYRVAAACEEETQEVMEDTLRGAIYELWRETKASYYLFALTGSTNYRNTVATIKPYKGNRAKVERPRWLPLARQYIMDEYKGFIVEGMEGDDICVSVAHRYREHGCIIASTDKDLRQYPGLHYNITKKTLERLTAEESDYLMWKQIITGDSTDNIGGLPGIGPVKADKYLAKALAEGVAYPHAAYLMYKELGYDYAYFQENLDLIRMRTDVYAPYEEHFVVLDFSTVDSEVLSFD